ncbi:MAG TPA: hypothetical protein V6D17_10630 [Candidatus Obscuribacterales bacterium]
MNPVILVGAASLGLLGYGLKLLRHNDVLENPPSTTAYGTVAEVLDCVADTLRNFAGTAWVWSAIEKDPVHALVRAECLCTERDERPIKLTVRYDAQKAAVSFKFEVHALLGRKPINKVLERTHKAIVLALEELFDKHVMSANVSIEELLTILQDGREAKNNLTSDQLADLTREIERRAVKELSISERRANGQFFVERLSERRVKIGRLRMAPAVENDTGQEAQPLESAATEDKTPERAELGEKDGQTSNVSL